MNFAENKTLSGTQRQRLLMVLTALIAILAGCRTGLSKVANDFALDGVYFSRGA
jgi:hypothetical protein